LSSLVAVARAGGIEDEFAKRLATEGQALFTRERLPGDQAGHIGDGLGPMYNDTSIYSDLLLHDMGNILSSAGSYGSRLFDSDADRETLAEAEFPSGPDAFAGGPAHATPASRREWRTPPLWGIRDSAPYLHDGRAETLEQAIAFHDGEAQKTRDRYFRLKPDERLVVQSFLKSLVAPSDGNARRAQRSSSPVLTSTIGR
jgi:CxxC motif-containing protein (DUF1111 family)